MNFVDIFSKYYTSIVLTIPVGGAEFFHEDGRTDMTKLIVGFHNFVNSPQICGYFCTNTWAAGRRLGPTDLFFSTMISNRPKFL